MLSYVVKTDKMHYKWQALFIWNAIKLNSLEFLKMSVEKCPRPKKKLLKAIG